MTQRSRTAEEIRGLEFDWLATDAAGHVGFFSTAGAGFAPAAYLEDVEAHKEALAAILSLPASSRVEHAPVLADESTNTWRLVAARGLFAFDSHPNGGPYRLIAAPEAPVRLGDLPESVRAIVQHVQLPHVRFDAVSVVPDSLLSAGGVSQRAALHALQLVLVIARKMAYDGDAHRDIAEVLDVAEYLPRLIFALDDRADDFRAQLQGLAEQWPEFARALACLDEPDPAWPS
jgi:hypothetical protein